MTLPQCTSELFVTDGGLETTLVFHEGIELPDFAAFPLLDHEEGRAALRRYFEPYLDLAQRLGTGIVLDTPTWRANPDWGARLGYDAARLVDVNRRSVAFASELAASPAYYMVNCAHPTHFAPVLEPGQPWLGRVKAIRANASTASHAELDAATELDRGDPEELARRYAELRAVLPDLRVVGGCCGTDHEHVATIAARLGAAV
jgi:S-methylmethionine-dependent homocysteine/selenocysteine methylase